MDLSVIIGINIQNLRKAKNMTQKDLADIFNYTPKAVSKWERGEATPEISTLKAIADYFGVTVDCLLKEKGFENKKEFRSETKRKATNLVKSLMVISIIWTIAAIAFVYNLQRINQTQPWVCFLYALTLSALPPIYFYRKENYNILNLILYSIFFWGILVSVYFTLFEFDFNLIFLIGIPTELTIIFFTILSRIKR